MEILKMKMDSNYFQKENPFLVTFQNGNPNKEWDFNYFQNGNPFQFLIENNPKFQIKFSFSHYYFINNLRC